MGDERRRVCVFLCMFYSNVSGTGDGTGTDHLLGGLVDVHASNEHPMMKKRLAVGSVYGNGNGNDFQEQEARRMHQQSSGI